jgi:GTPase
VKKTTTDQNVEPTSALDRKSGRQTAAAVMRAAVLVPNLTRHGGKSSQSDGPQRSLEARLEEACGLAMAIDLEIVHRETFNISSPRPATLIGSGIVAAVGKIVEEKEIGLVIVDQSLTPVQQRNLERAWNAKVIDRTGLILEIFGRRAKTKEGVLQVELAHLTYQKGRLVRSWTHLERQRSGGGFLGGPGETQIELDRRLLQDKIDKLKLDLEQVMRTRLLHRAKRKKVPQPIVALVGYTNAGKSTLFNRLTGAGVLAEDMLFATLDPTLRKLKLPHGRMCILSDTVGFISNLPTHLVAAFRATLEEVIEADIVLHVRDVADPDTMAQADDVNRILEEIGIGPDKDKSVIDVWNKIDLIDPLERQERFAMLKGRARSERKIVEVSAISGEGTRTLLDMIEECLAGSLQEIKIKLPQSRMKDMDWIYKNAEIIKRRDNKDGSITFDLRMSGLSREELLEKLAAR